MSLPATATPCVGCSRLKVPEKCTLCQDSWILKNNERSAPVLSDMRSHTIEELANVVLKKLDSQGYCVIDKFHKEEKALGILKEVQGIHDRGLLQDGQLTSSMASVNIRGDQIAWIDGSESGSECIAYHMKRVDYLISLLNKNITHHTIKERTKVGI